MARDLEKREHEITDERDQPPQIVENSDGGAAERREQTWTAIPRRRPACARLHQLDQRAQVVAQPAQLEASTAALLLLAQRGEQRGTGAVAVLDPRGVDDEPSGRGAGG